MSVSQYYVLFQKELVLLPVDDFPLTKKQLRQSFVRVSVLETSNFAERYITWNFHFVATCVWRKRISGLISANYHGGYLLVSANCRIFPHNQISFSIIGVCVLVCVLVCVCVCACVRACMRVWCGVEFTSRLLVGGRRQVFSQCRRFDRKSNASHLLRPLMPV